MKRHRLLSLGPDATRANPGRLLSLGADATAPTRSNPSQPIDPCGDCDRPTKKRGGPLGWIS